MPSPNNISLSATYQSASSLAFQDELALTLTDLSGRVPGGVLVFFPSYALLERLQKRWRQTGAWKTMTQKKAVLIEDRRTGPAFDATMKRYRKLCVVGGSGATFFCVYRGKLSEGIDFSDRDARCVVCIGIPYPNLKDLQVQLKQEHNSDARIRAEHPLIPNGRQWYNQCAFRALNQSIGRAIRHARDYGAIILIDPRFNQKDASSQLSKWVRPLYKSHATYNDAAQSLDHFFAAMNDQFPLGEVAAVSAPIADAKPCFGPMDRFTRKQDVAAIPHPAASVSTSRAVGTTSIDTLAQFAYVASGRGAAPPPPSIPLRVTVMPPQSSTLPVVPVQHKPPPQWNAPPSAGFDSWSMKPPSTSVPAPNPPHLYNAMPPAPRDNYTYNSASSTATSIGPSVSMNNNWSAGSSVGPHNSHQPIRSPPPPVPASSIATSVSRHMLKQPSPSSSGSFANNPYCRMSPSAPSSNAAASGVVTNARILPNTSIGLIAPGMVPDALPGRLAPEHPGRSISIMAATMPAVPGTTASSALPSMSMNHITSFESAGGSLHSNQCIRSAPPPVPAPTIAASGFMHNGMTPPPSASGSLANSHYGRMSPPAPISDAPSGTVDHNPYVHVSSTTSFGPSDASADRLAPMISTEHAGRGKKRESPQPAMIPVIGTSSVPSYRCQLCSVPLFATANSSPALLSPAQISFVQHCLGIGADPCDIVAVPISKISPGLIVPATTVFDDMLHLALRPIRCRCCSDKTALPIGVQVMAVNNDYDFAHHRNMTWIVSQPTSAFSSSTADDGDQIWSELVDLSYKKPKRYY